MRKPFTHNRDLANLPSVLAPLTEEKRWVNWSWELRVTDDGERKWTKPPRRPSDPNQYAKSNDPKTWDSYEQALQRWEDREADGIGYMLKRSGIGAIDLDHCCQRDADSKKTKIDPWARELREKLADGAYCEVTVSGTGLRLIGKAFGAEIHRKFMIDKERGASIELFRDTNRFITVSGIKLNGSRQRLPSLDELIDVVLVRYDKPKPSPSQAQREGRARSAQEWDDLIRNGAPNPDDDRSDLFHSVIWHLANKGWTAEQIVAELAHYPHGIAEKYVGRLAGEVNRSYDKWQRQQPARRGDLPIIRVSAGEIARIVDEAQEALVAARLPIFVRGGRLVEPRTVEREASDGRVTTATVFAQINDEKLGYLLNKKAVTFEHNDGRIKNWTVVDPPKKVVATLSALGNWQFPEVVGVVSAPTLRPDGSLLSQRGYDAPTRLWCDAQIALPPIAERAVVGVSVRQ